MKITLWILILLIAFWNITGGSFMMNNYVDIATVSALKALPQPFWTILGLLQILLSVTLIVTSFMKKHTLASFSAAGLAVISLAGLALYSSYAGFPGMLWGLIPAAIAGFIAYGKRMQAQ